MLISSFALCRVKFLLSLTAVVVSLQFLVFVVDQVVTRWRCKRLYYRENCRYCERSLCFNAIIVQIVALYTLFLWLKRRTQQRESRYFWNPIFTLYTNKPHSLVLLDGKAISVRKKLRVSKIPRFVYTRRKKYFRSGHETHKIWEQNASFLKAS